MPRLKDSERNGVMSETRRRLLDSATAEFAKEGYNGANVNRISRSAGYAKGTIYNYFPSKRALMLELIDMIATSHYRYMADQIRGEEEAARRLQCFFEAGSEWIVDNLSQGKVMLTMLNGPDTEFKLRMWQGYQPLHQLIIDEILAPGVEAEVLRQEDPRATAGLLMTLYLGIGSTVDEEGRSWLTPEWVSEFVLAGLRKRHSDVREM